MEPRPALHHSSHLTDRQEDFRLMADDNKIKELLTHDGRGWWNLPETDQQRPQPPREGPIGDPWFREFWSWFTYAGRSHATVRFYLVVAAILSVFTFLEWRLFSIDAFGASGRNSIMLAMSLIKFTMVVAFFMHLRFEKRQYTWIFAGCMALGIGIFLSLLLLQRHHGLGY
jgi:cytochrome c oxidase subunit 4